MINEKRKLKLAAGIIFFNDCSSLDRCFKSIENDFDFLFDIHGTGHESVQVGGQTYTFEVLIGTDEQRSIKALTDVDPDVRWNEDRGLIPLLQKKA